MKFNRFIEIDQLSERTTEWIERVIDEYGLNPCPMVEIKTRELCIPHYPVISSKVDEHYVSNDRITEIIVDNRLFAMMYERRDDGNYTEVNQMVFGTKKQIIELKRKSRNYGLRNHKTHS